LSISTICLVPRGRGRSALSRTTESQRSRSLCRASAATAALAGQSLSGNRAPRVTAGKAPYVRFDVNDYSIPRSHVRRSLTLLADLEEVRFVDGEQILASCRARCI
jgi:hypothetical protein